MSNTILVITEQREGKLNRVSWETLAAETGWVGNLFDTVPPLIAEVKKAKAGN